MKRCLNWCRVLPVLLLTLVARAGEAPPAGRWSVEKANAWYASQPWLVGCNFLPSTAVNDVEMWRKETFDPKTIERELDLAKGLGFNTVRVFINFVTWDEDSAGLRERFGQFLEICGRRGILVMPVLLDDCNFAGREAAAAPQPDPIPGVHNSQWVSSPPLKRVADRAAWPRIEEYVTDMIGAFGKDRRIVVWDLYNEPGNSGMGDKSLPLVEAAFEWARKCQPIQPLTVAPWADFNSPMSKRLFELSDVISFHGYDNAGGIRAKIKRCAEYGRPILCTEYLHRQSGNTFQNILPIFREANVGAYNWGLVAGRTQTYFPWGSPKDAPEPAIWQHDIFRRDGTPFSEREVVWIKRFTGRLPAAATVEVVPTARRQAVEWRYTLDDPGEGWMRAEFDDSKWRAGPAPFGKDEPPIGRAPRTQWTTQRIWLRRTFDLPEGKLADPVLLMHYDEDPEVYLNGILAARPGQYTAEYVELPIVPEAAAVLKSGKNTLAVLCRQTIGGQFIDAGIIATEGESIGFDHDPIGQAPRGWTATKTGAGEPVWTVVRDETAPSAPQALKQSGQAAFPLCIKDDVRQRDGFVQVRFKAISGKVDQAAGVMWRVIDADNYYIARANALEDNVVLYKVEKGKRSSLDIVGRQGGYGMKEKVTPNEWHALRVEFAGDTFRVLLDGKHLFDVKDPTFTEAGKVGVWTKADSVTLFDDFAYGER